MPPRDRSIAWATLASVALHALVLGVRPPATSKSSPVGAAPIAARIADLPAPPEERKAPVRKRVIPVSAASPAEVIAPPPLDDGSVARYRQQVISAGVRYKAYPPLAAQNGWQGDVLVQVSIAANGAVQVNVKRGSGFELLDEQAVETFRHAAPQIPLPLALRGQEFGFEVRAVYSLGD